MCFLRFTFLLRKFHRTVPPLKTPFKNNPKLFLVILKGKCHKNRSTNIKNANESRNEKNLDKNGKIIVEVQKIYSILQQFILLHPQIMTKQNYSQSKIRAQNSTKRVVSEIQAWRFVFGITKKQCKNCCATCFHQTPNGVSSWEVL